jgi:hypothetical protein
MATSTTWAAITFAANSDHLPAPFADQKESMPAPTDDGPTGLDATVARYAAADAQRFATQS